MLEGLTRPQGRPAFKEEAMTEMKHTPEPWYVEDDGLAIYVSSDHADTGDICDLYHTDARTDIHRKTNCEANAKRIVACVNALAGCSDELLKGPALKRSIENSREMLQELKAAVVAYDAILKLSADSEEIMRLLPGAEYCKNTLERLIAKVEGRYVMGIDPCVCTTCIHDTDNPDECCYMFKEQPAALPCAQYEEKI